MNPLERRERPWKHRGVTVQRGAVNVEDLAAMQLRGGAGGGRAGRSAPRGARPSDFFGEIGLLVTGRRTASVVSLSPMRLIVMFESSFRRLERELPVCADAVRAAAAARFPVV